MLTIPIINIRSAKYFLALLFAVSLFLVAFAIPENGAISSEPAIEKEFGSITGKVLYQGGHVRNEKVVIKDEHTCGAGILIDESLLADKDGGLQWAVVSITSNIESGSKLEDLKTESILDQSGCVFKPHIVLVGVDQPLIVTNSDQTLHNVRTISFMNDQISRAQIAFPGSGVPKDTISFSEVEVIETVCDVHGWMKAYVHVVSHPYYVITDNNGGFLLENVPSGKYTLQVWHETLGELNKEITVSANAATKITFSYKEKKM